MEGRPQNVQGDGDHNERQMDEANAEADDITTFMQQIAWVFIPLRPFYAMVKSSSSFAHNLFSLTEDWVHRLVDFLAKVNLRNVFEARADEIPEEEHPRMEDYGAYIDPILKQIFKIWLQAHQNLLTFVDYIANLYEDIVPLTPGDVSWNNFDKHNLNIRERCFKATMDVGYRLCWHCKKFIQLISASSGEQEDAET